MNRLQLGTLGLSLLLPTAALGDFQYQETTQITGGALMGMMKFASHFSKQAKEIGAPVISSVYVQGNRMARIDPQTIQIIDLDAETITNVDLQKHTYTRMTFEQMRQQFEQAVQQAKEQQAKQQPSAPAAEQKPNNVQVSFKVNVRNPGTTKQVSGVDANEAILTMEMIGTDTTNGQQGAFAITNDMWMAPEIPGYDELRDFQKKFAIKMGQAFSGSGLAASLTAMQPAAAEGMSDMVKEMSKLKGIPVEQITRMGATANGEPLPAASEAPLPPSSSGPELPSAKDVAQQSASSAIASKLGGFGGFGGFGHKKQSQAPPPADDNSTTAQQTPTATVLMESKTELSGFASTPIDAGKFAVPDGFTEIQPQQPQAK
ncbi:MAG TPA: hypothetical protein VE195_07810 [Acidobacteriaceae bacterium]|nr:hypothetical protein [Acidobacteriaceae bacterium]